jgi:hypothetical protein
MKLIFAKFSIGRIALHLICYHRDHKWAWHAAGINRELHFRLW